MQKLRNFLFSNSNTRQTIVKNTFWLFMAEASGRLLKMGLIIYAARKLGADGWGIFAYAISVASLLMLFSDIGISSLIIRDTIQKKDGYQIFISTALLLKIILLLISTAAVFFISPYISNIEEARILFPIIGLIFLFDAIREVGFAINRALEKMEREMMIKVIMNSIILVLGIILVSVKPLPIAVAIAYATGSGIGAFLISIMIKNHILELITKTDLKTLKLVLKTALPFAIITLTGSIMANTDIYMLSIWKTPEDIGMYSVAQRFYQFILIIPSMIASATLPLMSRLANNDNDKFRIVLEKTISAFMIIGIPIAFGGLVLADQIMPLVFGPIYINAIPVLQIFMIMLLTSFPLILLINTTLVYNEQKKLVLANIFGVLMNVILNYLLIPKFGITGAALATLVSSAIVTFIVWVKIKKINHFEILPSFKNIFLPVMAMTLATLALKYLGIHVLLNIIISALIYLAVIFLKEKSLIEEIKGIR
ncbi:MAG: flippase [bacterium]|nr:flippase [bacterium]